MEGYEKLLKKTREMLQFQTGLGIIRWDLQTHMPPRGMKQRSEQLGLMSKILHRMSTDEGIKKLIVELEKNTDSLDLVQRREVQLVKRRFTRSENIPEEVIARESAQRTLAIAAWRKAKEINNWKIFEPELLTLLEITKSMSEIMMENIGAKSMLDAQMDMYEPGLTIDTLSKVFKDLRKKLVPLVEKYSAICEEVKTDFMSREVPCSIQKKLITDLTGIIGFDTTSDDAGGRIDDAEHPFTTGYYDDVRLTIKCSEDDISRVIFGGLHETGHALYNQNNNPDWKWMILGKTCSSGFSESQARFAENMIGKSHEFWEFYYPRFQDMTGDSFRKISQLEFLRAINLVRPTSFRMMADEVTYCLHIIIRFEIERALFDERIEVSEIPDIWNSMYEKDLGIAIDTDTDGALQDMHWAWNMWGYFPTYALGNLYSAMLSEKLTMDIPEWRNHMSKGNLESTVKWLIENVHRKSCMFDPQDLLKDITGKALTVDPFIQYLDVKFSKIYD
ncbi:MAG: carboxypeptidase M32 [Candidatus Thorarchaeota archaeon]